MYNKSLRPEFYLQDTITVAKQLLGKILVIQKNRVLRSARIVETEAYIGEHDPACHAYRRFTNRSATLYENGGTIYVYFIYGNHYCFNVVTEPKGRGCAVLVRAVEPVEGLDYMIKRRGRTISIHNLTNGPGKMTQAMGIDASFNRKNLFTPSIYIYPPENQPDFEIVTTTRIGINVGKEFPYRFYIKNNPFISRK
ncbi:MAG: DNA-3-methyladenine glycosylase [Ignavibacteria bacterium]